MIRKYFRYLLFFFLISNILCSQNKYEDYRFINIKEGISKRAVTSIIQDHYGFMWIGTNGAGLYKYDGVNYIAFENNWKKPNSINSDFVHSLFIDSYKRIWVGTNQGLCLYNRDLNKFQNINLCKTISKNIKCEITVRSILQDNSGNLFIATQKNGLFTVNLKTLKVAKVNFDTNSTSDVQIYCLAKNKEGEIYLGTDKGLKKYDRRKKSITSVFINSNENTKKIISERIESILFDNNQDLWLGTFSNGLIKLSKSQNTLQINSFPISNKRILSILNVDKNKILCSSENDGLFLVNNHGEVLHQYLNDRNDSYSLKSNSIWSLYKDKENRIWLGYYNRGVATFNKLHDTFNVIESQINKSKSLQVSSATSIVKDREGKLWVGMEGGGVDVVDLANKNFIHINSKNNQVYSGLHSDDIQVVFIDSKQNVWLGSWNDGIYFLKSGSKRFINFNSKNTKGLISDRILSFAEDSKGTIWIGSYLKGIHCYDPSKKIFNHLESYPFTSSGLSDSDVRKVLVDSKDRVWVGTSYGLFQVVPKKDATFLVKKMNSSMPKTGSKHKSTLSILSLYESRNKTIWVGTDGDGLYSYNDKDNQFMWHNDFVGLNEKLVSSIIESKDGSIWLSGKSGITKLDLKAKTAHRYTTDDGLLANDFNFNSVLKDEKGVLYFGSYEGINYFDPNKIPNKKEEPSLYLNDFKIFNKSIGPNDDETPLSKVISETDSLTLNHNQSVFTIEYIGINYSYPGKNEYAFYLEGLENNWNYVGNSRTATYTNLEPGEYIFKVKSRKKRGSWNREPLSLYIKILPPWWKSNLAYFFYLLMIAGVIIFINKIYQNRFKVKQAIKLESERAIQIEKLNEKKLQFFTNISHEFRTPLTLIINPLEDLLKSKNTELSSEVLNKLLIMHKSSDRLSNLINELMDFRKLQSDQVKILTQQINIVEFTQDIFDSFKEEALKRNMNFIFESTSEKFEDWMDVKMFEKIIINIISNAFKVTSDGGMIKVIINTAPKFSLLPLADIEKEIPSFEISVQDTGVGLNEKDIKKIFNRFYQVNNLNKAYYGSTGIGLEVVKGFVELHKGRIDVESKLGVGTKFTIIFPIGKTFYTEEEIINGQNNIKPERKLRISSSQVEVVDDIEIEKKHTILIVEDDIDLRSYLKGELKKNYKVIVTANGKNGFELALEKLPDLILTDVIMPVMSGLELCKKLKSDIRTSHIPILMLSAKAMVKDKLEGIDSGADMYLSKPFDMDILKSSLAQLISSRQIMFNRYYTGITKETKEKTTTLDNEFIQKVLGFINENINESELSVEVLASNVFLSRSQLYRKIKTLTGVSVNEFIRNIRLEKAKELIELGDNNINEISYKVGFTSSSYFTKCFKAKFGHLPTQNPNIPKGMV